MLTTSSMNILWKDQIDTKNEYKIMLAIVIYISGKYIGVNSFGFGGVNGHVILEPYINENKDEFVQGMKVCDEWTFHHYHLNESTFIFGNSRFRVEMISTGHFLSFKYTALNTSK